MPDSTDSTGRILIIGVAAIFCMTMFPFRSLFLVSRVAWTIAMEWLSAHLNVSTNTQNFAGLNRRDRRGGFIDETNWNDLGTHFSNVQTNHTYAMQQYVKRAVGCMYGQVIGDSLGCRYEFKIASAVQQRIQEDRNGSFLPILGGGPFQLQPGQVTDDSEMALSLAASLIRCGTFNPADIACSYVYWAGTDPPDIGKATFSALSIGKRLSSNWPKELNDDEKESIYREVLNNVKKHNAGSLSNGCLMRISPLAIYSINVPPEKVKEMVYADCSLTHSAETCKEAVFAYVMAIRDLLNGRSNKEAFETALNVTRIERVREHLLTAQEKPIPVNIGNQLVNGDANAMGYIGVALQSAFYELLHGSSFEKSLVDAIARGGDTDTNGAIVGAMLGARFGVDNIPEQWINTVKRSKPRAKFSTIDYDVERIVEKLLTKS